MKYKHCVVIHCIVSVQTCHFLGNIHYKLICIKTYETGWQVLQLTPKIKWVIPQSGVHGDEVLSHGVRGRGLERTKSHIILLLHDKWSHITWGLLTGMEWQIVLKSNVFFGTGMLMRQRCVKIHVEQNILHFLKTKLSRYSLHTSKRWPPKIKDWFPPKMYMCQSTEYKHIPTCGKGTKKYVLADFSSWKRKSCSTLDTKYETMKTYISNLQF